MLKKCLDCVKNIKLDKVAVFAGGVLFGTAGLKVLGSKDAKKVYTQGTAAVLRAKDCVMKTTNVVQENAEDILAEAKQINEKRYEKENSVEEAEEAEETTEATAETTAEAPAEEETAVEEGTEGTTDVEYSSIEVEGVEYFKLRDLADIIGFGVDYDAATSTVVITTEAE